MIFLTIFRAVQRFLVATQEVILEARALRREMRRRYPFVEC
ncbi:hypothetical protein QNA08_10140 [Chelatococcus sp. SYSU_G07232]|uniref:Uncharacterized protein n=1 Tax=Chelatococcus albus TaxID=3047466 RepID=A0ABT7AGV1_9HYPH|nr:hypothetical protein [Chelatococcus sp. SYSU_G07232]MDJ1158594.1 hypothetical protein [Chelatococcus sp. SYSU_G07232]